VDVSFDIMDDLIGNVAMGFGLAAGAALGWATGAAVAEMTGAAVEKIGDKIAEAGKEDTGKKEEAPA